MKISYNNKQLGVIYVPVWIWILIGVCLLALILTVLIILLKGKKGKKRIKVEETFISNLMEILGGKENIVNVLVDNARLKFQLKDIKKPNFESLKEIAEQGVFITGNNVKVLFKYDSKLIKKEIEERL